ncbi:MAG: alpha/beta hydrolase [Saprospiraceae bacterium]|nr:alpha/beta hydrolase [Saprospiraceae bacterium]
MSKTILLALGLGVGFLLIGCQNDFADTRPNGRLVPKIADEDPSIPSIPVNGAVLHAEAFGPADSAIVVVIHGGPGSDYRYLLNCKEIADHGYRVVFYDQRGAGLSQRFPKKVYDMELLYEDLNAVIAHYRTSPTQKVFLLGHSWGAMLASAYINTHLDAVDGAILGEPGGLVWKDVEDYLGRSRSFGFFSEGLNDAVFFDQILTGKEDEHEVLDYKFDLLTAVGDSKDSPVGNEGKLAKWRSGAVTFNAYLALGEDEKPDWTENLDQFTTPVLFIYSENNEAYGLKHAEKVSSAYPNVELFETLDAGHDMLSFPTGWNNTLPVMLDYLTSLK